jgi:hypothetical protein
VLVVHSEDSPTVSCSTALKELLAPRGPFQICYPILDRLGVWRPREYHPLVPKCSERMDASVFANPAMVQVLPRNHEAARKKGTRNCICREDNVGILQNTGKKVGDKGK